MAKLKEGIILYQIEKNGCLNGVYTNESQDGKIYNEIARHKDAVGMENSSDVLPLEGEYDSLYFDDGNAKGEVDLKIDLVNTGTYKFTWFEKGTTTQVFWGVGYKMNAHQLVVHYEY